MDHYLVLFATEPFSVQCSWQLWPNYWCQLEKWNLSCRLKDLSILVHFCTVVFRKPKSTTFLSYETNATKFPVNKHKADMASILDNRDKTPSLIFSLRAIFSQSLDLQKIKVWAWEYCKGFINPYIQTFTAALEFWFHMDPALQE